MIKYTTEQLKHFGDILPIISRHRDFYDEKLLNTKMSKIDESTFAVSYKLDDTTISIIFGNMITSKKLGCIPCDLLVVDGINSHAILNEVLLIVGLKRFLDEENGEMGLFNQDSKSWCVVNPDIPEGHWENNMLEKYNYENIKI